mgnify:CR=1 FL=1
MTQLFFGRDWPLDLDKTERPSNATCYRCGEQIGSDDSGALSVVASVDVVERLAEHRECFLRAVVGSVGHLQQKCSCFGGIQEDPPDMTKRQAAQAAVDLYLNIHSGN